MVGGRKRPFVSLNFNIREIQNGVLFNSSNNYGEYNSNDMYYENMEELQEALPALVALAIERGIKWAETVNTVQGVAGASMLSPGAQMVQATAPQYEQYNPDDS